MTPVTTTDSSVVDQLEITALLNRYARAVDGKDWELYRSVFTDDALHRLLVGGRSRRQS